MTDSKHKASARSRRAWFRSTGGQVAIAVGVLALALVLWLVVRGGDEQQDPAVAATTHVTEWKTADGHAYAITVTPVPVLAADASGSGCVPVPAPGKTNLRFTVRIDNKGTDPAPVPQVRFAATVDPAGVITASLPFAKASKRIDVSPQANLRDCAQSSVIHAGSQQIDSYGAATFTGLIGGVKTPVTGGLAVIVRYPQAGAGSTADVVVPFPALK